MCKPADTASEVGYLRLEGGVQKNWLCHINYILAAAAGTANLQR